MTVDYTKSKYYTNRELSWLDFNNRVLEEARDKANPLLERVRFLGITQSNVDEFFMVRVASLSKLAAVNYPKPDASGMTAEAQLLAVNAKAHDQVVKQYSTLNRMLLPLLANLDVHVLEPGELSGQQTRFIEKYFNDEISPALTPMAVDSSRPFPFIGNNTLNIALRLFKDGDKKDKRFATVQVPDIFPRTVRLPGADNDFIMLEDIIKTFIGNLFIGYQVKEAANYRVIRDMDLDVAEEDTSDLLKEVEQQLKKREHGGAVRLEVELGISQSLRQRLIKSINIAEYAVYEINGPIDLTCLSGLTKQIAGHDDEKYPDFQSARTPGLQPTDDVFKTIRQHDVLVHHPYDNFSAVTEFIRQAAYDDDVLAIKMTLYRVSANSPIIKYLGSAAQNGKQVTVLVEVKARFDEENNVHWAQQLEKMGCHVIYGLIGLKTHCKLTLIVRREADGIRRYMHMGTGNYNDVTAHFYTDLGLLTTNTDMGIDASNIFNMLSGYSEPPFFHQLHMSPDGIRTFISKKIDEEIAHAKAGQPAWIEMKMNSLSDSEMIAKLYEASHAGVHIKLIVRGICCLNVGIPGLSENIEVHSIVGRYLEHSRIYAFANAGDSQVYLSSADLMTRNLNRRVELLFPILNATLRQRVFDIFNTLWHDNVKTRVLMADRSFTRVDRRGLDPLDAQASFMTQATKEIAAATQKRPEGGSVTHQFKPMLSPKNQPKSPIDRSPE
ncbi:polyphosphate kinase [Levilactobacillus senmaizukei DSM 21775 = NBRC 103853]|uniref:Polyphosphate kinase n=1 Tax=Levilactobacillus senmaizukei DSM 21775 = NBRC 103853 TaxID=1423803 RepID=A0A0R2DC31_9LACO|nr:RNA degradosome polyphosphate kinase [Levilactobacillus senmaizukei]KRN01329.1 polyphosphate kinase [Levilactobacillus senmaizukei DSM 21775 = NBRC 103853]